MLEDLYRPIAARIEAGITARSGNGGGDSPGFVVGLCGPQGSGKSTGANVLADVLERRGFRVAILALDDLYLTRAERLALAESVHPLLATRGPPGTHSVAIAQRILDGLGHAGATTLPRFDKAADDRAAPDAWTTVEGPVDIILFEGWCVGASPQNPTHLIEPVNDLERVDDPSGVWRRYVNDQLARNYAALFSRIDFQILLQPPAFEVVAGWRIEQEQALDAGLGPGHDRSGLMSDDDVGRFVQIYERLTRWIMVDMPARADMVVDLDPRRQATIRA